MNNMLFQKTPGEAFDNQSHDDDQIFDEPDFEGMIIQPAKNEDFGNENSMILIDEDQQNQPSMIQEEGLNTLILDSQSIIMDGGGNQNFEGAGLIDSASFDQKNDNRR